MSDILILHEDLLRERVRLDDAVLDLIENAFAALAGGGGGRHRRCPGFNRLQLP